MSFTQSSVKLENAERWYKVSLSSWRLDKATFDIAGCHSYEPGQVSIFRRGSCYPESLSCPDLRTIVTTSLQKVWVYTGGAIAGVMCSVNTQQQRWALWIVA